MVAVGFARSELALERKGESPLVPPHLFRERPMLFGLALTLLFYIANAGLFVVLPFLFNALGLGPFDTGIAFAPLGVAFVVSSLAGRRLPESAGTAPMIIGSGLLVVGLIGAMLAVSNGGGAVLVAVPLGIYGSGSGLVYPRIVGTVLARVPAHDAGAASGVLLTATQIANALGVAIVGGVFIGSAGLGVREAFTIAAAVVLAFAVLLGLTAARFGRGERGVDALTTF